MADFVLENNQNVSVSVGAVDSTGTPVPVSFDPGSVLAVVSDAGSLTATVAPDELTINVRAVGPLVSGNIVTVSGSVGGVALTPATLVVDVAASPAVAVTLTPGAPVAN